MSTGRDRIFAFFERLHREAPEGTLARWSAPWKPGAEPTPAERREWAADVAMVLHGLTTDYSKGDGGRPMSSRYAKHALWMAWNMVFSTQEFEDWLLVELEAFEAAERRRDAAERASKQRQRRRKRLERAGVAVLPSPKSPKRRK